MHHIQQLKICILLMVVCVLGFGDIFVAAADKDPMTSAQLLQFFFSILSWIWIIPAYFAGQFLTNSWVYGTVLGMDSYLWACRNLMKNIANFALAFLFVFSIFRTIFSNKNKELTGVVKDLMLKLLVAGIAIQSSWFLISATIDVSTIGISAVGALPSQLIATNSQRGNTICHPGKTLQAIQNKASQDKINFSKYETPTLGPLKLDLFSENEGNQKSLYTLTVEALSSDHEITDLTDCEGVVDIFMPSANSLAGPLIFLGISIFDSFAPQNGDYTGSATELLATTLINGVGIALYAIAMIMLCIIAFLRILYLWVFIALSPILILLYCFEHVGKEHDFLRSITSSIKEKGIDVSSILSLIFKPVFITLAVSAVLIFATLMQTVIQRNTSTSLAVTSGTKLITISDDDTNVDNQPSYTTSFVDGSLTITFKKMTKTFAELMLMIFTLILMRFILKLAITSKREHSVIDKFSNFGMKTIKEALFSLQVIPLGNGQMGSINILSQIPEKLGAKQDHRITKLQTAERAILNELFGDGGDSPLYEDEKRELQQSIKDMIQDKSKDKIMKFADLSKEYAESKAIFTNSDWLKFFEEWKKNLPSSIGDSDIKTLQTSKHTTLTEIRQDRETKQAFWNLFGNGGDAPYRIPSEPFNVSS